MELIDLNNQQREIIFNNEKVKRVIACAGSGKTFTITQNIFYILNQKLCKPSEILAITFTRNAAENMRIKIKKLLKESGSKDSEEYFERINIYTFNSFGNLLIFENSFLLGYGKDYKLINIPKSWQILYNIVKDFNFKTISAGKDVAKFIDDLLHYIWDLKSNLITVKQLKQYCQDGFEILRQQNYKSRKLLEEEIEILNLQKELAIIYEEYEREKKNNNLIDYHDHVFLPYQLLIENPKLRKIYSERFKYIFIDEYQDTDVAQGYLISLLFNPEYNSITIVGDDDQSIYSFRGACVENILNFHKWDAFSKIQVKDFYLSTNYRSGKSIITSINSIIIKNTDRFEKIIQPADEEKYSAVFFSCYKTHEEEAKEIAENIKKLILLGIKLRDIAVISRQKRFKNIINELKKNNISYELISSRGFFYEQEVLFIISWLVVLDNLNNEYDNLNNEQYLLNLIQSDKYNLSDRDIFYLKNFNTKENCFFSSSQAEKNLLINALISHKENKYLSKGAHERIEEFLSDLDFYLKHASFFKLSELMNLIATHSGLLDELKSDFNKSAKNKIKNIEALIKIGSDFEVDNSKTDLNSFILYLKDVAKTDEEDPEIIEFSENNTVKIMSIHAAKGLEFEVVFMPMLRKNQYFKKSRLKRFILPSILRKDKKIYSQKPDFSSEQSFDKEIKRINTEEERRIFYVGCSRAKSLLFLSFSEFENQKEAELKEDEVLQDGKDKNKDKVENKDKEKEKVLPFLSDILSNNNVIPLNKAALLYLKTNFNYNRDLKGNVSYDFINHCSSDFLNRFRNKNEINKFKIKPKDNLKYKIKDEIIDNFKYKFKDKIKDEQLFQNNNNIKFNFLKNNKLLEFYSAINKLNKKMPQIANDYIKNNKKYALKIKKLIQNNSFLVSNTYESRKNFSLTELLDYMNCRVLYKLKYIYNVAGFQNKDVVLGQKVHAHIKNLTMLVFKELTDFKSKKLSIKDFEKQKEKVRKSYFNKIIELGETEDILNPLKVFCDSVFFDFSEVLNVYTEQLIYWRLSDFIINCQIDRIDLLENLRIIDYKLSKLEVKKAHEKTCEKTHEKANEKTYKNNHEKTYEKPQMENKEVIVSQNYINQLKAYTLACADVFSVDFDKISSFLFYLKNGNIFENKFLEEDLNKFKILLIKAINDINSKSIKLNMFEEVISINCNQKGCPYYNVCLNIF